MNRNTFLMIFLGSSIMLSFNLLGQSTIATNVYASPRFLGWDGSNLTNPLFTRTNNLSRTKINGNLSYEVNGFTDVRNGYMLLSPLQNGGRGFTLFPLF
jgi:hypothetical protein